MTARALPRSLEDLRGRRAARWVRESTAGQADNFGPDAQAEQQARAIERWGLVDTGAAWQVAHSGRTIAATGQWAEMLDGAGHDWDVLVVGYVSRFARDLRTAVNARHDLHARGAVILFADERVLSSDEDEWERWAREAVEAEAYSRRLAKRIREGYAAKRRRTGVPGGNKAPFGTVREGRTLRVDDEALGLVRRVYTLAAGGRTDREVGAATGLALKHVAEILTNPFYIGRLWSGEPSALGPLVDPASWDHVQELRARYSRRHRGAVTRRQYGLGGLLACAACGKRLIGHVGRYRHQDACEAFAAAAPRRLQRDGRTVDPRVRGESYKVSVYEDAIGLALGHVAVSARLKAAVVAEAVGKKGPGGPDALAKARIKRERERAAVQYARDRDMAKLEATMARLDAEAAAAVQRPSRVPTAAEARAYLESLPELWAATSDAGRKAIAEAVFERIDVLGARNYTFTLTAAAKARGWDAAFGPGVLSVEEDGQSSRAKRSDTAAGTDLPSTKEGRSGRGERICPATNDLPVTMRLAEPPEPCEWLRSA